MVNYNNNRLYKEVRVDIKSYIDGCDISEVIKELETFSKGILNPTFNIDTEKEYYGGEDAVAYISGYQLRTPEELKEYDLQKQKEKEQNERWQLQQLESLAAQLGKKIS